MVSINRRQLAWLMLARAPGMNSQTLSRVLEHRGDAAAVLNASAQQLSRIGLSAEQRRFLKSSPEDILKDDLAWLDQPGHHLLTLGDEDYPPLLKRIEGPPPVLYAVGDPACLWQPQLAVVGSRNPTPGGRDNAREFCRYLSRNGWTITSGLAEGIDGEAHQAALAAGGATVAVAGTGPDIIYPASHKQLARRIASQGVVISEFPPGTRPARAHFPRRNRIISGLSLGTLVVEAAQKSGTLITAHHAISQGREVFAIPGSIHNPLARGCHRLIREGAKLVETAQDIMEELNPLARELGAGLKRMLESEHRAGPAPAPGELDDEYRRLLQWVGFDPTPVDVLVERSGLTPQAVSSMLLQLELSGHVAAASGGRYSRTKKE